MFNELINQWKQGVIDLKELEKKAKEYKETQIQCEKIHGIKCPLLKREGSESK